MSLPDIVIVDGVRFRQDDASRLGLSGKTARQSDPALPTTTAAQFQAQVAAEAQAKADKAAADKSVEEILAKARAEAEQIIAAANAAAGDITEGGADNGGDIPSADRGPSDPDGEASKRPSTAARTKASK